MSTSGIMLLLVVVVLLCASCDAEFLARCSNGTEVATTLTPSSDGVRGRYILEWCTDVKTNDAHWYSELNYNHNNVTACSPRSRDMHSSAEEYIYRQLPDCSNVCLSRRVDLLFGACYTVKNWISEHGKLYSMSIHNISNEYTREMFSYIDAVANSLIHEEYVSVHFNFKNVPSTDFEIQLSKRNISLEDGEEWHKNVDRQCARSHYEILCKLRGLFGTYQVYARSKAPWSRGAFRTQTTVMTEFVVSKQRGGAVPAAAAGAGLGEGRSWAWAGWALLALGAGVGGAALLLLALRCRRAAASRKHVLRDWLDRVEKKTSPEVRQPVGPILLLYARECAAAEPIIAALKTLLETVAPGQVYDIGSPTTAALAARDGGAWVRGVIARADARVLLLQTPALAALHVPHVVDGDGKEPRLEQPLLPDRAVYLVPAAADALLQFALRLLAHTAHKDLPYRKYYLATLEGLETEALPYAVPFRRYVLPLHAHTLLHDLRGAGPGAAGAGTGPGAWRQHEVEALAYAAGSFRDYAHAHPHYLMDELLFL